MKIKRLIKLFFTFFKIGAFTFGGGYAMIPLIQHQTVEKNGWISDDDILDIIAIAESTPGPIAINAATFVGYRVCGFFGAFFSTLGVVLPSFLIILAISRVLDIFRGTEVVEYAFFGIRAGVLALIVKAVWTMYKKSPKGIYSYIIMTAALVLTAVFKLPVLAVIIISAVYGLVVSLVAERRKNDLS